MGRGIDPPRTKVQGLPKLAWIEGASPRIRARNLSGGKPPFLTYNYGAHNLSKGYVRLNFVDRVFRRTLFPFLLNPFKCWPQIEICGGLD